MFCRDEELTGAEESRAEGGGDVGDRDLEGAGEDGCDEATQDEV